MSNYSNDSKPHSNKHNEQIINGRLQNPNNISPTLVNNANNINGVDLLYSKTTILGSVFDGSNVKEKLPMSIVSDKSNKSKDVHFDALVDANGNYLTSTELSDTIIDVPKKKSIVNDNYKNDYIAQFYVGSITVIGLFVLFRMIQKTR
jgi:hypothetical protein